MHADNDDSYDDDDDDGDYMYDDDDDDDDDDTCQYCMVGPQRSLTFPHSFTHQPRTSSSSLGPGRL